MYVGCWAGVTYFRHTVLTSPNKDETAVHCCDPALSVLVMLVSRNVFHEVSALQSIVSMGFQPFSVGHKQGIDFGHFLFIYGVVSHFSLEISMFFRRSYIFSSFLPHGMT